MTLTMTEHEVIIKKRTVRGEPRAGFVGMKTLYIPSDEGEHIAEKARELFDLEDVEDDTILGRVVVEDEPKHRVVSVEWEDE